MQPVDSGSLTGDVSEVIIPAGFSALFCQVWPKSSAHAPRLMAAQTALLPEKNKALLEDFGSWKRFRVFKYRQMTLSAGRFHMIKRTERIRPVHILRTCVCVLNVDRLALALMA
jgi:hypothetical protein